MKDFKDLFLLLKEYIDKQKENMTLGAVESLIKVLSALAICIVLLALGCIVLLFVCIALALLIGERTGSTPIGFAIMAGIIVVMALIFWINRKQWVTQSIASLMVRVLLENHENNEGKDKVKK